MNPLAWLNPGRWLLYAALALAVIVGGSILVKRHDEGQREIGRGEIRAQWDQDTKTRQAGAIEEARLAAAETQRRLDKQQENQLAQDALLARLRGDLAAARSERDGLQLRASAYLDAAGCGALTGDSALECVRQAAAKVVDVLGRCTSRLLDVAAAADDARARGLKCEADYDALTPGAP